MSSTNVEQRKENRRIRLAPWALAIGGLLGLTRASAERILTIGDQNGWTFAIDLPAMNTPSSELLSVAKVESKITSLGFDASLQPVQTNGSKIWLDSSAAPPVLVAKAFGELNELPAVEAIEEQGQPPALSIERETNVGSTGLLNLGGALITNLGTLNWRAEGMSAMSSAAMVPQGQLQMNLSHAAESIRVAPIASISSMANDTDHFADWIVKPDSLPTFSLVGATSSILTTDPIAITPSSLLSMGEPLAPMSIDLIDERRVASLAVP